MTRSIREGLHGGNKVVRKKSVSKSSGAQSITVKIDLGNCPQNNELAENQDDVKDINTMESSDAFVKRNDSSKRSSKENMGKSNVVLYIPEKLQLALDVVTDTGIESSIDSEEMLAGSHIRHLDEEPAEECNKVNDIYSKRTELTSPVKVEKEGTKISESLNTSFSTNLKQNLLNIHEIRTEKPGDYAAVCESYEGAISAAGPDKPSSPSNTDEVDVEMTAKEKGEDSKTVQKKSEREPAKHTAEMAEDLSTKTKEEKGKIIRNWFLSINIYFYK